MKDDKIKMFLDKKRQRICHKQSLLRIMLNIELFRRKMTKGEKGRGEGKENPAKAGKKR